MTAATLSPLDPAVIERAVGDVEYYVQVHYTLTGAERRAFEAAVDQAYAAQWRARAASMRRSAR
jgi:hypothetical protein